MTRPSHLLVMALFACCVSIVGGAILKDAPRQQARAAAEIFASLMVAAIVLAWLIYFLPI
jgi:hypothetical protein